MLKHYTQTCENINEEEETDVKKFSLTMLNQAHDDMNILHLIEDDVIGKFL